MPRARPTSAEKTMTPIIATSSQSRDGHCTASERQDDGVEAGRLRLGQGGFGVAARREGADANPDAAPRRGLRDLRVGLETELLDLLPGFARRFGVDKCADLNDEALRL